MTRPGRRSARHDARSSAHEVDPTLPPAAGATSSHPTDPSRKEADHACRHLAHTGPTHAEKYGLTAAEARAAEENLAGVAREEGLDYLVDFRDHGNTFDLHRLLHLSAARGLHDELLTLFYQGNLAAERSIYDSEHQVEIAVHAGLDEAEIHAVLADRRAYADEVRRDEDEAAQLGITSVPFFVIDRRYGVSGAQSVEAFAEVLRRAWAERQPEMTVLGADDQAGCDAHGCGVPGGGGTGEPRTSGN
ncbi:DsbA family protein [Micromonospora chokoriensis]|uniref:DsbA family protein n=1 Tax=Micromonospora chokoriensis TaxID=356851 RepID=UPI000B5AD446|nr:DsbA family protein [Micromonospora chokoriensis]